MQIKITRNESATQNGAQNLALLAKQSLEKYNEIFQPYTLNEISIFRQFIEENNVYFIRKTNLNLWSHTKTTIIPTRSLTVTAASFNQEQNNIFVSQNISEQLLGIKKVDKGSQDWWELIQAIAQSIAQQLEGPNFHRFHWQLYMWAMGVDPLREYHDRKNKEQLAENLP